MAYNTVIQQGHFTSDGTDKIIALRSSFDWVEVTNLTNIAGATQWDAVRWYWQRGMDDDDAVVDFHGAASQVVSVSTAAVGFNATTFRGISFIDSSDKTPGVPIAVTAGTNAAVPLYNTGDTGILAVGGIVRIVSTAHDNVNGLDFTVGAVNVDVNFAMDTTMQQAPGVVAGGAGFWRYIAPNVAVYNMFNPRKRVISDITAANPGVVSTMVDHGFTTGQIVRMKIPATGTMVELNDQLVTVTNINAGTFSIGVDTTAYTAFTFPLAVAPAHTPSSVIPVGTDGTATGELENTAFFGLILGTSATAGVASGSPGGTNGDAIKWRAGKSFAADIA